MVKSKKILDSIFAQIVIGFLVAHEVPHLMCVKLLDFPSKICQVSTQSIAETIIRFEKERCHFAHPLSVNSQIY